MAKDLEFRDGWRTVPDHVADVILSGVETHTMTYKDAIKAGERRLEGNQIYRAQQNLIRKHFETGGPE